MNKQNGQAAHSQQPSNARRRRSVVPAIPLSHEKRLAAKRAAATAAASAAATAVAEPSQLSHNQGADKEHDGKGLDTTVNGTAQEADTRDHPPSSIADDLPMSEGPCGSRTEPSVADSNSGQTSDSFAEATSETNTGTTAPAQVLGQPSENSLTSASDIRPPPVVHPMRYEMPRTLRPKGLPLNMAVNTEPVRGQGPHNAAARSFHQPRLSTSSVQFGEFGESPNASPVPPNTAAFAQPPGLPAPNGHPFAVPSHGSPYPAMMSPSPDMAPPGNFENYSRIQGLGNADAPQPFGNGTTDYRPQQGREGSQSTGPHDEASAYAAYPVNGFVNGHTPMNSIHSHANHGSISGPPGLPAMMPDGRLPHMGPSFEESQSLVQHLQQQFGDPDLSDSILELRFLDDRALPVRIPGHRILFNRSPRLFELLQKQKSSQGYVLQYPQTLLIETDDKWVQSNSFYVAVQSLYGLPLLPISPPRNGQNSDGLGTAGSPAEQLNFAISYVASGHLLHWRPVAQRGCEAAVKLLGWDTIERALEFALDGHSDKGSHIEYKYGRESDFLIHETVNFLARQVPIGSNLDLSVEDSGNYTRMPAGVPQSPTPATGTQKRDDPIQLGNRPRSQKVSGIRFGDLSLQDDRHDVNSDGAGQANSATPHAILSRILISVPFVQLKLFVDMTRSNQWADAETLSRITKQAIQVRELRRQQAVQAVLDGTVPNAEAIKTSLRSPEPRSYDKWAILGWSEETKDGFSVSRKWVPVVEAEKRPAPAYP